MILDTSSLRMACNKPIDTLRFKARSLPDVSATTFEYSSHKHPVWYAKQRSAFNSVTSLYPRDMDGIVYQFKPLIMSELSQQLHTSSPADAQLI